MEVHQGELFVREREPREFWAHMKHEKGKVQIKL